MGVQDLEFQFFGFRVKVLVFYLLETHVHP